jgi:hypothetical protein
MNCTAYRVDEIVSAPSGSISLALYTEIVRDRANASCQPRYVHSKTPPLEDNESQS